MIACIGGAHLDRHAVLHGPVAMGSSNPANVTVAMGGVARNVAENLARLGERVTLVSRVGNDPSGCQVREHAAGCGIDASLFTVSPRHSTASYTAILEGNGELVLGLADMDVYNEMTPTILEGALDRLREHSLWFLDANLPGSTIDWLLTMAGDIPVAVDAISVAKAPRLIPLLKRISLLFASDLVAGACVTARDGRSLPETLRACGARAGILTRGAAGITVWNGETTHHLPAFPAEPRDVTGAGDALVAGTLFGIRQGQPLLDAARLGLAAAAITVESRHAVAPELTADLVRQRLGVNA